MRWLVLKDLQILRRSPLLVGLLVIYPVAIALLIGFALSRGPDKPKVAFVNQVPANANTFDLGSETIDASKYSQRLFSVVDPIRVKTRAQAVKKVEDGEALAALIIPPDITEKLAGGVERPEVEVIYNVEDPVKARFVQSTIKARLGDANAALSEVFTKTAQDYIGLLLRGGKISLFGTDFDVLGLQRSKQILEQSQRDLPANSAARQRVGDVIRFASLAIDNLDLSDEVLASVSSPIKVKQTVLKGTRTPLDTFAVSVSVIVSLMFVTVLLAAGMLAQEREEHTFARLVRGLVSRTGLLAEKEGLAAICALAVTLAMLCGVGLFVSLDWSRFPLWVVALAAGALAFAALGVAIGAVAREVRTASLLAFLLSLPLAFLALVPTGAVSSGLYDVIRVVSALFPFKPALQALDVALNGGDPGLLVPLLHLVAVAAGFTVIARLGLRRFG
jgi:ABC-type transport system involved in multi-copper enzyme maturation permease subunit